MKGVLRRFAYVRSLEERIAELEKEAARKDAAMASMNRYIEQLETLKGYLEQQIAEMKRGYRP
jgi:phage shock protein A